MRPEQDRPEGCERFWPLDEELGELAPWVRWGTLDLYTLRLKAQTSHVLYHARREIYPLTFDGKKREIAGKAYILVPDMTLTPGIHLVKRSPELATEFWI